MKLSQKIKDLIATDNQFSLGLAAVLDVSQVAVRDLVRRDSDRLTLFAAVQYYKEKGFTEKQIFA
ncbi:hypothetical protein GCM10027051_31540 [Niabella terrae]